MAGRLSADIREEIRQRIDLVELVSAHVALKKAGRHYKGLCPFHQEKTPSFHVDRERGLWHCFGCSKGGTAFDFIMQISNVSFAEAAEMLARRAGVRLERSPKEVQRASERDRLYRALEAATGIFRENLLHPQRGRAGQEYLAHRGVDAPTAERFRLGYATANWDDLLKALGGKGFAPALLASGGVVQMRASGEGYYDMFRHRLIFPIVDLQDRPVAFGGRALDEAQPKYLNSKETAVFVKGKALYALNWAREAIRQHDEVIVVEGNMDVLTCHQYGITNAVATLGTALTPEQVAGLKRFAGKAVLVYDADAAGQAAMERAQSLFEEADFPVRVVVLPSGDPDEFLRTAGPEKFRELVAAAVPIFDYQVMVVASRHDAKTVEGKVRIVDALLPSVAAVSNPVRQAEYLRSLAQRFDLAEDAVRQRLRGRARSREARVGTAPTVPAPDRARHQAERLLVHHMVHEPTLRPTVGGALEATDFVDAHHNALARVLFASPEAGVDGLREALEDEETQRLLMRLVFEEPPADERDRERAVREAIDYIRVRVPTTQQRRAIAAQIHQAQAAGDAEQVRQLQMEYLKLVGPSASESMPSERGGRATPAQKGGDDHG